MLNKELPNSEEAERAILGGIMLDNYLANEVFSQIQPPDFYSPLHRKIATAMYDLMRTSQPIDPIMIGEELKKEGSVENIGGVAAIANLMHGLPHFSTLSEYIKLVQTKSLARKLIRFCETASNRIIDEDMDAQSILNDMIVGLVKHQQTAKSTVQSLSEVSANVLKTFEQWASGNTDMSSLKTGIPELDRALRLRGLAFGEQTLIAARPSTGKTALWLQILSHIAMLGSPVHLVSLEMTFEKIVMRMLASRTGVANQAISPYTLAQGGTEAEKLRKSVKDLTFPMYFDRSSRISQAIAVAENLVRTKGVKVVGFDYMTLFQTGSTNKNRADDVGDIAVQWKDFALRNNVAVLGINQFSRESEKEHRRPRMTDLRDSGVIEQAADNLLFPYDPNSKVHSQNPNLIKDRIWLDLYCAKQRDGARGWSIPIEYDKNRQIFETYEMSGREAPRKVELETETYRDYYDTDNDEST